MPATTKTDISVGRWLSTAALQLGPVEDHPFLVARVLLAHVLSASSTALLAHPETPLLPHQSQLADGLLERILAGEPLPHVLGRWEFYGLSFIVSPAVLIPRPETELLVDTAANWLKTHSTRRLAADIGTGSGCIAVALAAQFTDLQVVATDISQPALEIASQNIALHDLAGRVTLSLSDLLPPQPPQFDLVCANLPYIPSDQLLNLIVSSHEPLLALDGGRDGLILIRRLLDMLPTRLSPTGLALLEIEETTATAALQAAASIFPAHACQVLPDLAGRPRLLVVDLSGG